jgi:hypothetical protein
MNGITMAIPYAGEGRPRDSKTFVNLRTEAAWKLRNRLDPSHPPFAASGAGPVPRSMTQRDFFVCPGDYLVRLVEELKPLTYCRRQEDQALAQGRMGDHPGPFARRGGRVDPEHDLDSMKVSTPSPSGLGQPPY